MQRRDSAMGYFTGIFFGVFQGNMIVGSIIASGLMTALPKDPVTKKVPDHVIKILLGVYVAIAAGSTALMAILGHEVPPRGDLDAFPRRKSLSETVMSFFYLLKDKRILFMIAIIVYSVVEQGFIFVNFTGDVISPTLGTENIGWAMAGFGAVNVVASFGFGKLADLIGPSPVVITGWLSHIIFLIVYFAFYGLEILPISWIQEHKWFVYASVCFYSIGDAAFQFFPATMIGMLFSDNAEAGFANLKFWQSLGNTGISIGGAYIPFKYKIMISMVTLAAGIISLILLNTFVAKIDGNKRGKITTQKLEQADLLYS
jgi:predicted MFS family arabinose efflux permease